MERFVIPESWHRRFPSRRGVVLVELGSPGYPAFGWNYYAGECLDGHLRGALGAAAPKVALERVHGERSARRLAAALAASPPAILGLTLPPGSLATMQLVLELCSRALAARGRPESLVVLGGQLATYETQVVLTLARSAAGPHFPLVAVRGEGELAFERLVRALAGEQEVDVPNVVVQEAEGRPLRRGTPAAADATRLVHPASLATVGASVGGEYPTAMLQTSRGCFWGRCSYCTRTSFRNPAAAAEPRLLEGSGLTRWQALPRRRVAAELERLAGLGIRSFELADDELLGGRSPRALERCHWLAATLRRLAEGAGEPLAFRFFTRPDVVWRPDDPRGNRRLGEALLALARAGATRIYLGVEAGCPGTLGFYNRGMGRATVEGAIRRLRALGFELDAGFILFHPYQTPQGILEEIAFFRRMRLVEANQWPFRPLVVNRGSLLEHRLRDSGLLLPRSPEDVNFLRIPWRFSDPRSAVIHGTVERLARREREVMYTLKVISKKAYTRGGDAERELCSLFLRRHAEIYLRLLERSARAMLTSSGSPAALRPAIALAGREIDALLDDVRESVAAGRILDRDGLLRPTLAALRGRAVRAAV